MQNIPTAYRLRLTAYRLRPTTKLRRFYYVKVSYKWLQEFVDIDISPEDLADRLTLAGVAVEGVTKLGVGVEKVLTGRIEKIEPHPNADKLVVTSVNAGA